MSEKIGQVTLDTRWYTDDDRYSDGDETENRLLKIVTEHPEEDFPELGVPRLSIRVPFGRIRNASLAPRQYREIGQRIAKSILARW